MNKYEEAARRLDSAQDISDVIRSILDDGQTLENVTTVTGSSDYAVTDQDLYIFCGPSADIDINLPVGTNHRRLHISNYLLSGTNQLTLVPNGSETIDAGPSRILNPREAAEIVFIEATSNWSVI